MTDTLSQALRDVIAERRRQVEVEGWTPAHDDTHPHDHLARAAALYAMPEAQRMIRTAAGGTVLSALWPWEWSWWKPKDRRTDAVRAAALLIADIERMDRQAILTQARAS